MIFEQISTIRLEDENTWKGKVFLTFDLDWCHDDVLLDAIQMVEQANVPATWFITHDTPLLSRLRNNPLFELGIHPNFNKLLCGDVSNGHSIEEVVERLLEIVPDAKSVRSHSLTSSSILLNLFKSKNLTHECNFFIQGDGQTDHKPWKDWSQLIRVPHIWEDDLILASNIKRTPQTFYRKCGINVYDFHPIHVFINTDDLQLYENTRDFHQNPEQLILRRSENYGIRNMLTEFLEAIG